VFPFSLSSCCGQDGGVSVNLPFFDCCILILVILSLYICFRILLNRDFSLGFPFSLFPPSQFEASIFFSLPVLYLVFTGATWSREYSTPCLLLSFPLLCVLSFWKIVDSLLHLPHTGVRNFWLFWVPDPSFFSTAGQPLSSIPPVPFGFLVLVTCARFCPPFHVWVSAQICFPFYVFRSQWR